LRIIIVIKFYNKKIKNIIKISIFLPNQKKKKLKVLLLEEQEKKGCLDLLFLVLQI